MVSLADLWLPILLSAVLVFVASSLIHMVLGWHRHDFKKLPAEDAVMEALRPFNLGPGDYVAPLPQSMAQMSSPELKAKMASGPRFSLAILGAESSMPRNLVVWFIYSLVVATFAAYVAVLSLSADAAYMTVFRVTSTVAFAGFALAIWQTWIWYSRSLGNTIRTTIEGLIYALLTGGAFGWLWP
jgi:hypothetical protein